MTKIDGHTHYDQKIGHRQFGQATSDPTWPILCGMIATKPNGRNSNLAQSSCVALDGPSPVTHPFYIFSMPILLSNMNQAQHFSLIILGRRLFGSNSFRFLCFILRFNQKGSTHQVPLVRILSTGHIVRFFKQRIFLLIFIF
jgi:hypothetical protein